MATVFWLAGAELAGIRWVAAGSGEAAVNRRAARSAAALVVMNSPPSERECVERF
jgi:hypothetical protein